MEKQQGEENCECNVVGCILRRTRGWFLAVDFPFLRWTSQNWVVNTTRTWKWQSSKRTVMEASQQVKGYEFITRGRKCHQKSQQVARQQTRVEGVQQEQYSERNKGE